MAATETADAATKEIEVSLAKKVKIRGVLKGKATKLRNRVSEQLEDETSGCILLERQNSNNSTKDGILEKAGR